MQNSQSNESKFDVLPVVSRVLDYARHTRLMVIMGALGIMVGIVYFVYCEGVYESRSVVYVRAFGAPLRDREIPDTLKEQSFVFRNLTRELTSRRMVLGTALRMGLIRPQDTWEDVVRIIPAVRATSLDQSHLEVTVYATKPENVRKFPQMLVEEYKAYQEEIWRQYRTEAMERYTEELGSIETQVDKGISELSRFERERRLAEASIQQINLTEIPKDLIVTKERLTRLNAVRERLLQLEAASAGQKERSYDEVIALLSLLSSFEKENVVTVGDVIRQSPDQGPVRAQRKVDMGVDVIVEPSMVEGLEPWRELEKEKRSLDEKIQEASKRYLPDHQVMRQLQARLGEVKRSLDGEFSVMRERFNLEQVRLQEKLSMLQARLPEYHKVTEEFGKSAHEYSALAKGQNIWDKARERLADKLNVLTFAQENDWVEMQFKGFTSLRDEIPVSPNKVKLLMISIAVGLAGALGVSTLLNLTNTTVSHLQTLESQTGLKGIGIVPFVPRAHLEEVNRSPAQGATVPNSLLENFRVIRSNICLNPNQKHRSQAIMVTSARPLEGKTSQSANLAWSFYSMGQRTLLIDCDLRRGRIHNFTGVKNGPGMSGVLLGTSTAEEAIQKTSIPLLDILPRGPVVAGSTEILCQKRFEDLIAGFREEYERIVIDTPPVLGLSEATSLQRVVDGVVLVVRAETTPRKDVIDAVELLRKAGAHFFGFVLNAVDLSRLNNYYHYHYYSASYYGQFDPPEGEGPKPALNV